MPTSFSHHHHHKNGKYTPNKNKRPPLLASPAAAPDLKFLFSCCCQCSSFRGPLRFWCWDRWPDPFILLLLLLLLHAHRYHQQRRCCTGSTCSSARTQWGSWPSSLTASPPTAATFTALTSSPPRTGASSTPDGKARPYYPFLFLVRILTPQYLNLNLSLNLSLRCWWFDFRKFPQFNPDENVNIIWFLCGRKGLMFVEVVYNFLNFFLGVLLLFSFPFSFHFSEINEDQPPNII